MHSNSFIFRALSEFKNGWNHHSIRTAHHKSPHQLFTAGALLLQHSGLAGLDFFEDVDDEYGVDVDAPPASEESQVVVPPLSVRITSQQLVDLKHRINPLESSDEFGIDLYEQTLHYLLNIIIIVNVLCCTVLFFVLVLSTVYCFVFCPCL